MIRRLYTILLVAAALIVLMWLVANTPVWADWRVAMWTDCVVCSMCSLVSAAGIGYALGILSAELSEKLKRRRRNEIH